MHTGVTRWTLVLVVAVVAAAATAPAAMADDDGFTRLAGADRYATAAEIAEVAAQGQRDGTVVVARGDAFPDATVAARIAGLDQSPILLTRRDGLPAATVAALEALQPSRAVLLGGTAAIGQAVAEDLTARGLRVERVAGPDRYETAGALARHLGAEAVGSVDGLRTAILANGATFADALTAGPLSFRAGLPILLTPRDRLHPAAAGALADLGVEQVIVAGGEAAVGPAVVAALDGYTVRRVAGPDRTATAAALAELTIEVADFSPFEVVVARGDDYPDALSGVPYAGRYGSVLLLTSTAGRLGPGTRAYLEAHARDVRRVVVLGGTAAVGDAVLGELRALLDAAVVEEEPAVAYLAGKFTEVAGEDGTVLRRFEGSDEYALAGGRLALVAPMVAAGSVPADGGPNYPTDLYDIRTNRQVGTLPNSRLPILAGDRMFAMADALGTRDPWHTSIWVREADGSERRAVQLPSDVMPGHPDSGTFLGVGSDEAGQRLVFGYGNDVSLFFYDVWTADADTGALTRITDDQRSRWPAISPGGDHVVFLRETASCTGEPHGPFATDLVLAPAGGGSTTALGTGSCDGGFWGAPMWLSDGEVAAPWIEPADDGGFQARLEAVAVVGGAQRTVATGLAGAVSVSPSEGLLAYESEATVGDEDGGFVLHHLATGAERVFDRGWLPKVSGDRRW